MPSGLTRLLRILALGTLLAVSLAQPATADHCGYDATISPASGPAGTTFVFRTWLGATSDLRIYRDDVLVREVELRQGAERYRIRTGPGDEGHWRARAEVQGRPDCAAEATFTVTGLPDTSTDPRGDGYPFIGAASAIGVAMASAAVVFVGVRRRGPGRVGLARRIG